jgi:hypothetical protein
MKHGPEGTAAWGRQGRPSHDAPPTRIADHPYADDVAGVEELDEIVCRSHPSYHPVTWLILIVVGGAAVSR